MATFYEFSVAEAMEKVFAKGEQTTTMKRYTGLFTLFGAAKAAVAANNRKLLDGCKSYLDKYPYDMEHPDYSFELYEVGGIARAYLFYKGEYEEVAELIREYAEKTYNAPRTDDGIICYKKLEQGKWIWVDAIMAVAPFMLFAGLKLGEPRYVDFAAEQTVLMFDALWDPECGLLHQVRGRYTEDPSRLSEDHWSRGNGWMMVALAELIEYLPKSSSWYEAVAVRYRSFCENLIKYQSIRGLWRQEIPLEGAWEESSGSGLIAYGLGAGIRLGLLQEEKYKKAFEQAIWGIVNFCITDQYNTYHSCEANCFPGEGDQRGTVFAYVCLRKPYRNEPHSFGPILLALTEAYSNGITHLNKYRQYMPDER